jgi:hypothetical protein
MSVELRYEFLCVLLRLHPITTLHIDHHLQSTPPAEMWSQGVPQGQTFAPSRCVAAPLKATGHMPVVDAYALLNQSNTSVASSSSASGTAAASASAAAMAPCLTSLYFWNTCEGLILALWPGLPEVDTSGSRAAVRHRAAAASSHTPSPFASALATSPLSSWTVAYALVSLPCRKLVAMVMRARLHRPLPFGDVDALYGLHQHQFCVGLRSTHIPLAAFAGADTRVKNLRGAGVTWRWTTITRAPAVVRNGWAVYDLIVPATAAGQPSPHRFPGRPCLLWRTAHFHGATPLGVLIDTTLCDDHFQMLVSTHTLVALRAVAPSTPIYATAALAQPEIAASDDSTSVSVEKTSEENGCSGGRRSHAHAVQSHGSVAPVESAPRGQGNGSSIRSGLSTSEAEQRSSNGRRGAAKAKPEWVSTLTAPPAAGSTASDGTVDQTFRFDDDSGQGRDSWLRESVPSTAVTSDTRGEGLRYRTALGALGPEDDGAWGSTRSRSGSGGRVGGNRRDLDWSFDDVSDGARFGSNSEMASAVRGIGGQAVRSCSAGSSPASPEHVWACVAICDETTNTEVVRVWLEMLYMPQHDETVVRSLQLALAVSWVDRCFHTTHGGK